jgi:hypothetical protein
LDSAAIGRTSLSAKDSSMNQFCLHREALECDSRLLTSTPGVKNA